MTPRATILPSGPLMATAAPLSKFPSTPVTPTASRLAPSFSRNVYAPGPNGLGVIVCDTGHGRFQRLDRHGHVPRIGMQQMLAIGHDPDMAFPEEQITAPQGIWRAPVRDALPAPFILHVAVTRQHDSHGLEGLLGQSRAINPEAFASAP